MIRRGVTLSVAIPVTRVPFRWRGNAHAYGWGPAAFSLPRVIGEVTF